MRTNAFTSQRSSTPPAAPNRSQPNRNSSHPSKIFDIVLLVVNIASSIGVGYGIANMQPKPCRDYPNWTCYLDVHEQFVVSTVFIASATTLLITGPALIAKRIKQF